MTRHRGGPDPIAGFLSRPAVPLGPAGAATPARDGRSLSSSLASSPGATDVASKHHPPHQAGPRPPGRPPGQPPVGGSLLSTGGWVGDLAGVERAILLAELEVQRIRLGRLAELLLELGRRGEAAAARNIADGLERVAIGLA